MTPPLRPLPPAVRKAFAEYQKRPLDRLSDLAGLSRATGDAVQSFAMGATEPLDVKGALRAARRGIEAWHGSPHKFDKFSLEKIGTGEGAQAYGHGLYFAESRPVAEIYREMAEPSYKNAGVRSIVSDAIAAARKAGLDDNAARIAARNDIINQAMERPSSLRQQWFDAANNLDGILDDPKAGSLYRVRLDVSPDELLDWDQTLSKQPESVKRMRDALTGIDSPLSNVRAFELNDWLTDRVRLRNLTPPDVVDLKNPAVTERLAKGGVPGIRYLDGGSRAAGDGTRNYVIFDPERIQILERLAALGLGGQMVKDMLAKAKAASASQQSQPPTLPPVTVRPPSTPRS